MGRSLSNFILDFWNFAKPLSEESTKSTTQQGMRTCDGYEIRLADFDDMISCDRLRVSSIRVDHQGTYATPRRQHIASPY